VLHLCSLVKSCLPNPRIILKQGKRGYLSSFLLASHNPRNACDLSPLWTRKFIFPPLQRNFVSINHIPISAKKSQAKPSECLARHHSGREGTTSHLSQSAFCNLRSAILPPPPFRTEGATKGSPEQRSGFQISNNPSNEGAPQPPAVPFRPFTTPLRLATKDTKDHKKKKTKTSNLCLRPPYKKHIAKNDDAATSYNYQPDPVPKQKISFSLHQKANTPTRRKPTTYKTVFSTRTRAALWVQKRE